MEWKRVYWSLLFISFFGGNQPSWAHHHMPMEIPSNVIPYLKYGSPETFAEFHGYLTLLYSDFGKNAERNNRGDSSFDQHYFVFNAIANLRKNLLVFGEIEYEHGGEEIKVDRAYIEWGLCDALSVQLGKFYAPFGLELPEYPYPIRKLITRPLMTRNLLFNEWVEVGIEASGMLHLPIRNLELGYEVAVVNGPNEKEDAGDSDAIPEILEVGTGANPNIGGTGGATQNRDNNSNRTIIAHLNMPFLGRKILMGVSVARGRYSNSANPRLDFALFGVEGNYKLHGWDLRGELVKRVIDVTTSSKRTSSS